MKDPVAIYNAKSDAEAQALAQTLQQAGIETRIREEESATGFPMGGTMAPLESSQVWIDRADAERAAVILQQFEQTRQEREPELAATGPEPTFITAVCEECGESSLFAGTLVGSVQDCPHCFKFMDVAAAGEELDWGDPEDEEPEADE